MKPPAIANERQRILEAIENRICFDHLEKKSCDHSACYELLNLYRLIESGSHLVK